MGIASVSISKSGEFGDKKTTIRVTRRLINDHQKQ